MEPLMNADIRGSIESPWRILIPKNLRTANVREEPA
jgi:hypothetical protein